MEKGGGGGGGGMAVVTSTVVWEMGSMAKRIVLMRFH